MATLYLSRMMFKDSAGVFQFPDGDIKSSRVSISRAMGRVQGQSIYTRKTTGQIEMNYEVDLTFDVMQRKNQTYLDLIKRLDNSQNLSVVGMVAQTTGNTGIQVGSFITLTNCTCSAQDLSLPDQATEATITYSMIAEDYSAGNGITA